MFISKQPSAPLKVNSSLVVLRRMHGHLILRNTGNSACYAHKEEGPVPTAEQMLSHNNWARSRLVSLGTRNCDVK